MFRPITAIAVLIISMTIASLFPTWGDDDWDPIERREAPCHNYMTDAGDTYQ